MDNLERNQNYIYQLYSNTFGLRQIQEPKGYENDTRGYSRDADSRGFIVKTEIDLEFYGDGADYLYDLFISKGIQEKCLIIKYERDAYSLSENFKERYIQEIDLGTLKRDNETGKVTVKATQGGLFDDIKNRESDEYDLLDNLSADGIDIGEITTKIFKPVPRSLFLESLFKDERFQYTLITEGLKTSDVSVVRTIPMRKEYISGDFVKEPFNTSVYVDDTINNYTLGGIAIGQNEFEGDIFFKRSDLPRELRVKVKLRYKIRENSLFTRLLNTNFKLAFKISTIGDDDLDDVIREIKVIHDFNPLTNINVEKSVDETFTLDLKEGDSVSLCFIAKGDNNSSTFNTSYIKCYLDVPESQVTILDDKDYPMTISKCMPVVDFIDRIVAKITGKSGLVTSEIFTSGKYKDIVIDNGFWARQFPNVWQNPNEDEQKIQMKTSFKDAFESLNYLEPLCWFTYFDGNVEKIKIEDAKYTQQNFIALDLGEVDNIESEASKIDFFSSISIGHSQSMEYEELSGLDEPNGKSEFTTFITKGKSKYDTLSKIRTDATGYELIRRKPFDIYPKEDTSRDSNLFMHDAKLNADGSYTHLVWDSLLNGETVLSELPKGVFRPENLWNFRLSPMNRLYYGHGYSVNRGLYHYPKLSIRFNSSNANKSLITKIGSKELKEDGSLLISELETPRVEAEKVSFTFEMTQEIEDTLLGFTKVNNVDIPNYFGLIKYKEKGIDKYGRLIKLEADEEAKIQLIKARI